MKTLVSRRKFLNEDKTMTSFIVTNLSEFKLSENGVTSYPTFEISDCYKKIALDFSFLGEAEMRETEKKLKLLQKLVNEFSEEFSKQVKKYKKNKTNDKSNKK